MSFIVLNDFVRIYENFIISVHGSPFRITSLRWVLEPNDYEQVSPSLISPNSFSTIGNFHPHVSFALSGRELLRQRLLRGWPRILACIPACPASPVMHENTQIIDFARYFQMSRMATPLLKGMFASHFGTRKGGESRQRVHGADFTHFLILRP